MIRAQIAYSTNRGSDGPALLLRAAQRLEPLDLRMARDTYLDAMLAAHFAGRLAPGCLREAAQAARRVPHAAEPPTASELLLDGLAIAYSHGYSAGVPTLGQAVTGFRGPAATPDEQLRWLWPAAHVAMAMWDDESYEVLSARHIEIGREAGVLAVLPTALTTRIVASAFFGQFTAAEELIAEMQALTDAIGIPAPAYGPVFVSAWQGREEPASAVIDAAVREFTLSGEGAVLAFADYARAVLYNGLGRYQDALMAATATDAFEGEGVTIYTQGLAELIEAAARAGAPDRAADALLRLEEMTYASGTDWGAGVRARSQALLSEDDVAEPLYREAIERLGRTRIRPQLARAHLVYGEWLRRENRRVDARSELMQAFDMFSDMGMVAFLERAGRELAAAGEEGPKAGRGQTARPHKPGDADRPPRPVGLVQPRDRRSAVPVRTDGRMAPAQHLHQARHQLPPPARAGVARRSRPGGLTAEPGLSQRRRGLDAGLRQRGSPANRDDTGEPEEPPPESRCV